MEDSKKKYFVVSGCSFTFEKWNWPTFVSNYFNYELINVAMASQGNGLICKKLIYKIEKLLKEGIHNNELIVGIMWSGPDRFEFYDEYGSYKSIENIDSWKENPTSVIEDEDAKKWVILNPHWKTNPAPLYYKNIHSNTLSYITTIQNILLVQWYLEKKGIKYFMTTYLDIWKDNKHNHPEVKYWYDMIDFSKFIPIKGCYEWVRDSYPDTGIPPKTDKYIPIHPTHFGHEKFAEELVIPYLKNNLL